MPQSTPPAAMHLVGEDESQPDRAKQEKVDEILSTRPLIVVSNRGPVTFTRRKDDTSPPARAAAASSPPCAASSTTTRRSGSPPR
jgi:hypothetical protein